ncbi:MAG: hypothetical protein V1932_02260 [Chloroflexota bacterium]
MTKASCYLAIIVLLLGILGVVIGGAFIYQGISKNNMVITAMRSENVTYGLPEEEIAKGNMIDTAAEAQQVADTIKGHRHAIAPTYIDLLAASGGKYDPTNPKDLTYTQALNLENYLYMGVLALGVTQIVLGSGVFMVVTGVALIVVGLVLLQLPRKAPATS